MTTPRRNPRRNRGFSLVEILVVVAIIAALVGMAVPIIQNAQDKARSTTCKVNLSQMGKNFLLWKDRNKGRWPSGSEQSGIRFLLLLHRDGMIDGKDSTVFLCPGTDDINWIPDVNEDPGSAYADWDDLDPSTISYAGRDVENYRINKNNEDEEVIAADDNETGPNHKFSTNYLYADGATREFDIKDFKEELPEGQDWIPVGPDSPIEALTKLIND